MAAAIETTESRHLIITDSQDCGSSGVNNCQSQGSGKGQFEANWFSPSITSTQIVSFDLITSAEDDSQDIFLLTHDKENLFADVSLEEIPCPADHSCLLTSSDHTVVCETPPPQGKSVDRDIRNPTNYLFKSTRLCSTESLNGTPNPTMKAPTKRQSTPKKTKKPSPMKKVKLEGFSCKLNGALYHVRNRDLDVLEAIEKALNCIQQTVRQQDMCSVRHLCLQLNQVETVIGILDGEQLGLRMSLEAWNEMMVYTKQMFHDTQNEVDEVKRRRLELETCTDELTYSFSQSFSISATNQVLPKKQHIISANVEKKKAKIPVKSSNFQSKTLKSSEPVYAGPNGNEVQTTQILKKNSYQEGVLLQTSSRQTTGRNRLLKGIKKNPNKKSCDVPYATDGMHCSTSKTEKHLQLTAENSIRLSSDFLGLAPDQDFAPPLASTPCASRKTLVTGENDSITQASNSFEALPEVTISTTYAKESIPISNSVLGNVEPLDGTPVCYSVSTATSNCLLQMEEEISCADDKAVYVQEESIIIGDPPSSSQCSFLWSTNRTPEIVKMSFHLRPFILKGVLCPGKNNMKLCINSRIYVGSLAADGTIEMNGFNFSSVGSWIKSVEGKLFTKLSKSVQKTLDLQYNGKSLTQIIEVDEQLRIQFPREVYKTLSCNDIAPHSMLHPPMTDTNLIQKQIPYSNPAIQNPTPYLVGAGSNPLRTKSTIPNVALSAKEDLQFVPEEMTRHIKTIFLHAQEEYFPICRCAEQFWCGVEPFPKHILDEIDLWK